MNTKKYIVVSAILIFMFVFSLFGTIQSAHAICSGIIYVDADSSSGSPDGCSWGTAFPKLQNALALATSSDQIWVATGTYYPDEGVGQIDNSRTSTFQLKNGVSIYGGFTGGESLLSQRNSDPASNNTVLSGDIDGTLADLTGNAFHVVTADSTATNAVLDGFTITGGNTTGAGQESGAAILIADSSPTLGNLIIRNNTSALYGAGIYIFTTNNAAPEASYSRPSITNVTISDNTAVEGGGIYAENASPTLNNVVFNDNSASGNAFGGAGGGMHSGTLNISDAPSIPSLTNVIFSGNSARGGGGMYTANSNTILNNVTFDSNSAVRRGGGLFNENSNPILTNVTFYNNTSHDSLGTPRGGGGMMNVNSDPTLNNVTFSENNSLGTGDTGGDAILNSDGSNPQISNGIFWGDINDEIVNDASTLNASTVTISYSILQGGCPATPDFTCTNIVSTDPNLSALADHGGFTQTIALGTGSSALDTGDNVACAPTDQRGVTRPQGSTCDIGAYEFDNTLPAITNATSTTSDGTYNSGDLVNITVNFSESISSVGLTIILNSGGFINTNALSNVTSFSGTYTVGAGQNSADLTISSVTGTITDIATNSTPSPSIPAAQNIADSKSIVIDTTAPTITISNPNTTPEQSKTITASASDGALTMSITINPICDGTLTFITYSSQTFSSEADNGKKVCYKAVDAVGNIAYSLSNAIAGIDTTAPTITISNPSITPAQSKTITASTSGDTLTMSNTSGSICDGTLIFVAYSDQTFSSESDNGKEVCYKSLDTAGNTAYSLSNAIAGIDTTAPTITISNPDTTPALNKTITASPSDGILTMSNTNGSVCDSSLIFIAYSSQTFSSESDNSKKVCYKAVDAVGNIAYSLSNAIAGIDKTAPTITVNNPTTAPAQSKIITASTSDGTLTMHNTNGSICNGTLSFVAYSDQTFSSEADNGRKVCYKAVDALGNAAYSLSNAIAGIDTTAPTITISNPNTTPAQSKTITASTSGGTLTMSNTISSICDNTLIFVAYSDQTFSSEADNGKKVCYKAVDAVGNIAYSLSNAIAGIDKTAPTITINNPSTVPAQSKTITASTSDGILTMSNTGTPICDGTLIFVAYSDQTFSSEADNGKKVCYKAVDALGNTAYSLSNTIAGIDTTAPTVISFSAISPSSSLDIPITAFTTSDAVSVTGYMITVSATAPVAGALGWSATTPATYHVGTGGSYTLYPWAKDAAGNVSSVFGTGVHIVVDTSVLMPGPWVGGVSITSDKNVVTVGRPHVGSEVASYDGFAAGSLTSYVPMLFKTAYGSYESALYVQNVNASNTANITIKFYDNAGTLSCTKTDTITALASKGYWLGSESCLLAGWVGGAVVTSDQPIVTVGRPHVGTEVMTYDGFASGSLTSYIPMLFNNYYGYNAAFYIQNVHASNTANITIKYYDNNGVLNCTKTDTIAPFASKGYWVPSASCDTGSGSVPVGWAGGVVVTSDQPIVGVGRPHIGTQVTTYNGFTSGGLSSYVPMLFKGAFGGSYDSAYYIQNTDASNTANITIKYYDSAGVLKCTKIDTISPLASKGYWVPSATCDADSLPAGWVGGVVVTSDQPIVAVGRPHIGTQVTTYNGFTSGSLNAYLPMLFKNAFGSYDSAFYIQNTENSTAAVMIQLYDTSGNLSCTRTDTIPALSTLGFWVPSVSCAQ